MENTYMRDLAYGDVFRLGHDADERGSSYVKVSDNIAHRVLWGGRLAIGTTRHAYTDSTASRFPVTRTGENLKHLLK